VDKTKDVTNTSKADLVLVVENATGSRFQGDVLLGVDRAAFRMAGPAKILCDVAPGAVKRFPFQVRRLKPEALVEVDVSSPSRVVFAKHFRQPLRTVIHAGADPVRVIWSGNTVAEGALTLGKTGLKLALRVSDTNLDVHKEIFWDGSVLEIFLAPVGCTEIPLQLAALPDPKKPRIISAKDRRELAGAKISVRADKGGYDTEIFLPYKAAQIPAGKPFLMELIVRANALGDAHGRVSGVWMDSPNPHFDCANFAIIVP
jgi:hypothetical protein